ncbi:MAG: apolipoprotein N-acyltransferase [Bdellovibrionales bacterium]
MAKKTQLIYALIAGVLIGFSYIPFYAVLGMLAFIPLFLAYDHAISAKRVFLLGWLAQFILNLIGFHWVMITAHDFGYLPWPLSFLTLIVFASFAHLYFPLSAVLWYFIQKRFQFDEIGSNILKVLCFFLLETIFPKIFPWNFGYTWITSSFSIAQTAEFWGFVGLSFFTVMANVPLLYILKTMKVNRPIARKAAMIFICVFVLFNVLGYFAKESTPPADKSLKTLVVQANIGNFDKIQAEQGSRFQQAIIEKYIQITEEGLAKHPETELIVWPESALPVFLRVIEGQAQPNRYMPSIYKKIKQWKIPLFTGIFIADKDYPYNAALLFDSNAELAGVYKKSLLLAFGETIPGIEENREAQKFIKKLVPAISFFGRGKGPSVIEFENIKIGTQLCYEGIHPNFNIELDQLGTDVFINLTNDSWFGTTFEPYQHMYMTLARAIEFRTPLLRATNTGISTMIDAKGNIYKKSPLMKEWFGLYDIPIKTNKIKTLYSRTGTLTPFVFILLGTIFLILRRKRLNK